MHVTKSPASSVPSSPRHACASTTAPGPAAQQVQPVVKVVINVHPGAEEESNTQVAKADLTARAAQYERDLLAHQLKLLTQEKSQLRGQLKELATQQLQLHRAAMAADREASLLRLQVAEASATAAAAQTTVTQLQFQVETLLQQQALDAAEFQRQQQQQQQQLEQQQQQQQQPQQATLTSSAGADAAEASQDESKLRIRAPSMASLASHSNAPSAVATEDLSALAAGLFDDVQAGLRSAASADIPCAAQSVTVPVLTRSAASESPFAHFRPKGLVQLLPAVMPEAQASIAAAVPAPVSQDIGMQASKGGDLEASQEAAVPTAASDQFGDVSSPQYSDTALTASPGSAEGSSASQSVSPSKGHVTVLEGRHDAADTLHQHTVHRFSLPPLSTHRTTSGVDGREVLLQAAVLGTGGVPHPPHSASHPPSQQASPTKANVIPIKQQLLNLSTCSHAPYAYTSLPPSPGTRYDPGLAATASWGANRGWMQVALPHLQSSRPGLQPSQVPLQPSAAQSNRMPWAGVDRAPGSQPVSRPLRRATTAAAEGILKMTEFNQAAHPLSQQGSANVAYVPQGPICRLLVPSTTVTAAVPAASVPITRQASPSDSMLLASFPHKGSGLLRMPATSLGATPARSPVHAGVGTASSLLSRGTVIGADSGPSPLLSPRRSLASAGPSIAVSMAPSQSASLQAIQQAAVASDSGPASGIMGSAIAGSPIRSGPYRANTLPATPTAPMQTTTAECSNLPPGPTLIRPMKPFYNTLGLSAVLRAAGPGPAITMAAPVAAGTARIHALGATSPGQTLTTGQLTGETEGGRLWPALDSTDGGWGVWQQGLAGGSGTETPHSHAYFSTAQTPSQRSVGGKSTAAAATPDLHAPLSPMLPHHMHWAPGTMSGTPGIRSGVLTPGGAEGSVPLAFGHTRLDENLHLLKALEAITQQRRPEIDAELELLAGDDDDEIPATELHVPSGGVTQGEGLSKVVEGLESNLEAERREANLKNELTRERGQAERAQQECYTLRNQAEQMQEQFSEAIKAKADLEAELAALRMHARAPAAPEQTGGTSAVDATGTKNEVEERGFDAAESFGLEPDIFRAPSFSSKGGGSTAGGVAASTQAAHSAAAAVSSIPAASGGQDPAAGSDAAESMQEKCRGLLDDILGSHTEVSATKKPVLTFDRSLAPTPASAPAPDIKGSSQEAAPSLSPHPQTFTAQRPHADVSMQAQTDTMITPHTIPDPPTPNAPRRSAAGAPPPNITPTVSKPTSTSFSFSPVSPSLPSAALGQADAPSDSSGSPQGTRDTSTAGTLTISSPGDNSTRGSTPGSAEATTCKAATAAAPETTAGPAEVRAATKSKEDTTSSRKLFGSVVGSPFPSKDAV